MFVSNAPPREILSIYKAGTNAGATASLPAVTNKKVYLQSLLGFTDESTIIEVRNALTGTIAITNTDATITGTGTLFTTELIVGDCIRHTDSAEVFYVASITSDTSLEATVAASSTDASSAAVRIIAELKPPFDDTWTANDAPFNYVVGGALHGSKGKALDCVILSSAGDCAITAVGFTL